jgi:hypothetical protein
VHDRAQGAIVALERAVMLMYRDEAKRAQQIEHERGTEPRIESPELYDRSLHIPRRRLQRPN